MSLVPAPEQALRTSPKAANQRNDRHGVDEGEESCQLRADLVLRRDLVKPKRGGPQARCHVDPAHEVVRAQRLAVVVA
jgi:hypothetical protein